MQQDIEISLTHGEESLTLSKKQRLALLFNAVRECKQCAIVNVAKNPIFLRGFIDARVLVIKEFPSLSDDITGLPVSGIDAVLLDAICELCGLSLSGEAGRVPAMVTTLIGHTPIMNQNVRSASAAERAACAFRISGILNIVQPKLLVLLGKEVKKYFEKVPRGVAVYTVPSLESHNFRTLDTFKLKQHLARIDTTPYCQVRSLIDTIDFLDMTEVCWSVKM